MAEITQIIAKCFLGGESYISVVFDDNNLKISHFELRGDTSATLNIHIIEPDVGDEIIVTPPSNLGENVISVAPIEQWYMILDEGSLKLPAHLRFEAEWIL